ncbi:unnamed protein product, partial [Scytosiphon promiscuus]
RSAVSRCRARSRGMGEPWSFTVDPKRSKKRARFNLLALEHDEYYFQDYSAYFYPPLGGGGGGGGGGGANSSSSSISSSSSNNNLNNGTCGGED